ncbi:hypothetical protein BGX34_006265 [Mortierella sp. NVP85]|nr:hypothetical protein BGX34_006265 [Mortierella sp. NVP85]
MFKNAEHVVLRDTDSDTFVPFLLDDDFELLQPQRISHYPGAVLDVVLSTLGQAVTLSPAIPTRVSNIAVSTAAPLNRTSADSHTISHQEIDETVFSASIVEASSGAFVEHLQGHESDGDCIANVFDSQSSGSITEVQQSFQQTLIKGQSNSVTLSNKLVRRSTNDNISVHPCITLPDTTPQTLQILLEQILNNQAIHSRQMREMQEYSIPRLFIILPKPRRKIDAMRKPFREEFKLFFLCECDHHTDDGSHTHPHRIHLAKHEGYDLVNVDEFFKRYGSYVRTILEILRVGIATAGIVVPGLSQLGVERIESASKALETASRSCRPLFDDAISSLKNRTKGDNELVERNPMPGQMDFNNLKALEGADLRQLVSFFQDRDRGRVLGNLNQVVTRDGGVRWVCNDHCHRDSSSAAVQRFKAIVEANGGTFLELDGCVTVDIKGRRQAKDFYEAMVRTPRIRQLTITLQWEVTQGDLEALETAATKTGIPYLRLHFHLMETSRFNILNSKKCYNPIVQLMCNGHVELMDIYSFESFYQRVSKFPIMMKSRLEGLRIHPTFSPSDRSQKTALKFILKHSPLLRKLEIAPDDLHDAFEFLANQAPQYLNLEDISWTTLHSTLKLKLSRGIAQDVEMTIMCLDNLSQDVQKLIQQGCLTKVDIRQQIDGANRSRMVEILQRNARLAHVNLRVNPRFIATVIASMAVARRVLIKDEEVSSIWCDALKVIIDLQDLGSLVNDSDVLKVTLGFGKNMATPIIELHTRNAGSKTYMDMMALIHDYGRSIERLETTYLFTDSHAFAVEYATRKRVIKKSSKITSVHLCPRSMTFAGLECMGRVIERSTSKSELYFSFMDLHNEVEREKAIRLIRRYGKSLHSLSMTGNSADEWILRIAEVCPTRVEVPQLVSLNLDCCLKDIPSKGLRWIREMLSVPSNTTWNQNESSIDISESHNWQPLQEVVLRDRRLRYEDTFVFEWFGPRWNQMLEFPRGCTQMDYQQKGGECGDVLLH